MGVHQGKHICLIVPTFGRTWQLRRLFQSLDAQSYRNFEVIVSDQNPVGFLDEVIDPSAYSFKLTHICSPNDRGISKARNLGWAAAPGDIVAFPDDDAWYPADFLQRGVDKMTQLGASILTGRSVDVKGRTINGRFARHAQSITRGGVWIMQIEWATFFERSLLEELGGFDEGLGIGCPTPWQAAEGPDLILRALAKGKACFFEPDLVGYHEEYETHPPSAIMTAKARAYARGMGYVLRKNGAGLLTALYWSARPLFQLGVSLLLLEGRRAKYFFLVAVGRMEGWARLLARWSPKAAGFTGREVVLNSEPPAHHG
jgi:glycosyltransferase involved in cell wall biosynthesis